MVRKALRDRQMDPSPVDSILALDAKRRAALVEPETLKAERNAVSKEIGKMKDPAERQVKVDAMRTWLATRSPRSTNRCVKWMPPAQITLTDMPNIPDEHALRRG